MSIPTWTASQILEQFKKTMPFGRAWPREAGTVLDGVLSGFMPMAERVINDARSIVPNVFPATASYLLLEWQKTLGLPDPCAGSNPSIEQQQRQVAARMGDAGGSSIEYYVRFAKTLGCTITITEFSAARADFLRADDPVADAFWDYVWRVNAPETTVNYFSADASYADEALATWGDAVLECEITSRAPAHTRVFFSYG